MCLMEAKKVRSGSRDAISCFPDEILSKILSFLPTKRAVSTSLLSKRWKNLFPLMIHIFASQHHFDFDESDLLYPEEVCKRERKDLHKSFIDFVDKTISGSNSMEKLSLKCQHGLISHELTDQWIRHALDRGVVDLDMCLITRLITETNQPLRKSWVLEAFLGLRTDEVPEPNQLPPTVFMNKTLVKLTLGIYFGRIPIQFPKVFLPVLKSLFLHSVWYTNETLCDTLLLGSPILEELTLHHLRAVTEPHLDNSQGRMTHKTLKRLTFHYNNSFLFSRKMSFNIPSLVYLDYSGLAPYPSSKVGFVDSLVEAKLDVDIQKTHDVYNHLVTIINSMRNVETLSLSSTSVKAMYSNCEEVPFFLNLVRLYFESNTKEGWEVLPRLLNKSPKLETLVLKGLHCVDNQGVLIDDKYEVKVVEIHGFRGSDREMRQVKCYLWQMHFLQVMKFEVDVDDDNKKPQLINELLALPKHVSKCKIQFL